MSKQRNRDTGIELAVRKLLHAQGLRYRVNHRVPGMPRRTIDIAFTKLRIAVFMDGCFWHGCPLHATHPQANGGWWAQKLERNKERDQETTRQLEEQGWTVLRFWEHEESATVARAVAGRVRSSRDATDASPEAEDSPLSMLTP